MTELNLLHYNKGTLVNMIKKLEEENERLKKELICKPDIEWELETKDGQKMSIIQSKRIDMQEKLNKSILQLTSRIDKAIAKLDSGYNVVDYDDTDFPRLIVDDAMDILQGVDKE